LKVQLPSTLPTAKSGALTKVTALTEAASSGMEVIIAMAIRPIHILPKPVFLAMASPYRASLVPENRMITTQTLNLSQTTPFVKYVLRFITLF